MNEDTHERRARFGLPKALAKADAIDAACSGAKAVNPRGRDDRDLHSPAGILDIGQSLASSRGNRVVDGGQA